MKGVGERVERQDGRETNLRCVLHKGAPKCTGVEGKLQLNLESKCDARERERGEREEKRERRGEREEKERGEREKRKREGRERELREKEERERERRERGETCKLMQKNVGGFHIYDISYNHFR